MVKIYEGKIITSCFDCGHVSNDQKLCRHIKMRKLFKENKELKISKSILKECPLPNSVCPRCKGSGILSNQGADVCCPSCQGTGI
jgi:hypothetical protein